MPAIVTGRTRPTKAKKQDRAQKRKRDDVGVEKLEQAVSELDPKAQNIKDFTDLPLSEPTKAGLKACHFTVMTDIQTKAIPLALKGEDILGAAKTGSGKTLAFVIPVLENLYRAQCVGTDAGLGAMIISPTRELAIQIFDVLYKIGRKGHMFAAGLIIGGKSLQEERDALTRMNIVVCTPGRMLQHLSQTAFFNVDGLRMLVLDEADRILDMGFQRDVDAIIDYLPRERQTLLFSATQTRKLSDLARLSLKEPEYVSVHEAAATATPKGLQQNYVLTTLPEKLDTLWSFIQASKKSKILVFLSSGKQVRFVYESFRKMQPGIPLLHLHGRQKQTARLDITKKFSSAKTSCLFATDVAARGLDFPAVDWVVQVDCPEDADTYIHRVGRTARYERDGRAVIFLDPSEEEGMLQRLEQKKVPVERINIRSKKQQSIKDQLQHLCFKDPQLKYLGQKAFVSYARSIHVQHDKEIFQLSKLDLEGFASSLGLPGAPRIKFVKGDNAKELKNAPRQRITDSEDNDESSGGSETEKQSKAKKDAVRTKYDRMFERRNQDVLADHYSKLIRNEDDEDRRDLDDEDDFLNVKRRIPAEPDAELPDEIAEALTAQTKDKLLVNITGAPEPILIDSNRRAKMLTSKKQLLKLKSKGARILFDDEGNAQPVYRLEDEQTFKNQGKPEDMRQAFLIGEREKHEQEDVDDKMLAKEKRRVKREKKKERERNRAAEEEEDDDAGAGGVQLGNGVNAFENFLADARSTDGDDDNDDDKYDQRNVPRGRYQEDEVDNDDEEEEERPQRKKQKKWFEKDEDSGDGSEEDDDDEEGRGSRRKKQTNRSKPGRHSAASRVVVAEPQNLEDLEALATGLLG